MKSISIHLVRRNFIKSAIFITLIILCPEMHVVTNMHQNLQICQADFAMTSLTKIFQNCQFHQSDFTLRNLTDVCQNHKIHISIHSV